MACDRFRWVYCQLDTLRRCFPSSIRKTLNELPPTLDETYERTLQEIPKEKKQHAHRLFQCLIAAIRPLRVEELAEIFAIDFDEDAASNFVEDWRPEIPEEAMLSACSTLIAVIDDNEGSRIVQFSHFSVKEFLTSDRLRTSEFANIAHFHIPPNTAHTILAQACLTVLLQLDENIDKKGLAKFSLAFYAAQHWFIHAKNEYVAPHIQHTMEVLFDPSKPYLAAWVWIHDVDQRTRRSIHDLNDRPSHPNATALYYAVSCGLVGPSMYLISTHGEDVNARCGESGSPLHGASKNGHLDAVSLLLDHWADINLTSPRGQTPLWEAYHYSRREVMRLLLERGAAPDLPGDFVGFMTHYASHAGRAEVVRLLLRHNADVNATGANDFTPLHWASAGGHADVAQILLEHGANMNALSIKGTPLYEASEDGHLEVARLLLARGADPHIRVSGRKTPFQCATGCGHAQIAQLLSEHGAERE